MQHVRATAADCAGEGARFGALRGNTPELGAQRSRELLSASLSPRFADHVEASVVELDGLPVVQVDVDAPLPVIGLFGVGRGMRLSGHAVVERAT